MVGGILADVWVTAERNTPMVLFTGATLLGTGEFFSVLCTWLASLPGRPADNCRPRSVGEWLRGTELVLAVGLLDSSYY